MNASTVEIRQIRRELAESGADPFEVAAIALAETRRYREELARMKAGRPR